jgi:hypothetical protein
VEQPERVGISRRRDNIKTMKSLPTQPIPDQLLHTRISHIILFRQKHEHSETVLERSI